MNLEIINGFLISYRGFMYANSATLNINTRINNKQIIAEMHSGKRNAMGILNK